MLFLIAVFLERYLLFEINVPFWLEQEESCADWGRRVTHRAGLLQCVVCVCVCVRCSNIYIFEREMDGGMIVGQIE